MVCTILTNIFGNSYFSILFFLYFIYRILFLQYNFQWKMYKILIFLVVLVFI
jgi:hypothetical protein